MDRDEPMRPIERIETLDVLRGVAICGILLMNIPEMGLFAPYRPAFPAVWNADWIAWVIQHVLFNGTMRGLFTLLFGAGMLLMLRRSEGANPQITPIDVWTRRCLALLALGVVNFLVLLWPGEILFCYGLTGFALLAFRTMRPRTLIAVAMLCMAVLTVADARDSYRKGAQHEQAGQARTAQAAGRPLTDAQKEAVTADDKDQASMRPTAKENAEAREARTHWPAVAGWSWGQWSDINLGYFGWIDVLESLAFMLIGMALFRTGVPTGRASRGTYLALVSGGYAIGLSLRVSELLLAGQIGFTGVPGGEPLWTFVFRYADFEAARLAVTFGHLGWSYCSSDRARSAGRRRCARWDEWRLPPIWRNR